jgi:ANTAR domain
MCAAASFAVAKRLACLSQARLATLSVMPAPASTESKLRELYTQASEARTQARALAKRLRATRRKTKENWHLIQSAWERAEQVRAAWQAGNAKPDRVQHSAYARLQAQLESMPVIEQAKGIIMARYGWAEDEAFDALRRASQRSNVRVRELAAAIVAGTVQLPQPARSEPL